MLVKIASQKKLQASERSLLANTFYFLKQAYKLV